MLEVDKVRRDWDKRLTPLVVVDLLLVEKQLIEVADQVPVKLGIVL